MMAENYPVTRAQQTILAVVFTLVGMGIMLWMTDWEAMKPQPTVTEAIVETTRRVPGERTQKDLERPQKREGLPARPAPQPPLNDPGEWKKQREEIAKQWRQDSIDGIERYSAKAGLSAEKRQELMDIIMELHDRHDGIRAQLETNSISQDDAMHEMGDIDLWVKGKITEAIGQDGAEAFRAEMDEMKRTY